MDASLAAALELEMLDRIGDVGALTVDACLFERAIEELLRRRVGRSGCRASALCTRELG
jgi:hypothetical protein